MTGCSQSPYVPLTPEQQQDVVQPTQTIHTSINTPDVDVNLDVTTPGQHFIPYVPDYNPFANSIQTLDATFVTLEQDFMAIAKTQGGIEILIILSKNISIQRKVDVILALPHSLAKQMLIEAGIDHFYTIQRLVEILEQLENGNFLVPGITVKATKG